MNRDDVAVKSIPVLTHQGSTTSGNDRPRDRGAAVKKGYKENLYHHRSQRPDEAENIINEQKQNRRNVPRTGLHHHTRRRRAGKWHKEVIVERGSRTRNYDKKENAT